MREVLPGTAAAQRGVYVLALCTFAFGSGAFIFAGLLEDVARDLHVGTATAGQLQTAYVLSAALLGPILAALLGRVPARTPLLLILPLAALVNLLCLLSAGFGQLMALRVLLGPIASLAGPAAAAAAASMMPEKRGFAVAIVLGGMTMAFMIGMPFGSLVGDLFGWRATFVMIAAFLLLALLAVYALVPKIPVEMSPVAYGFRLPRPAPVLLILTVTILCFAASMTGATYVAPILRTQAGITGAGVGVFQMIGGIGCVAGLAIGARCADADLGRWGIPIAISGLIGSSLINLNELHGGLPSGLPTVVALALAFFCGSASLFAIMPILQSRLLGLPGPTPFLLTLNGSANTLGQAIGASLGGFVFVRLGIHSIPLASIAVSSTAMVLWILAAPAKGNAAQELHP